MSDKATRPQKSRGRTKTRSAPLWVVCLFLVVLIGVTIWIGEWFVQFDELQRCFSAGHHDCGPPIVPPNRDQNGDQIGR